METNVELTPTLGTPLGRYAATQAGTLVQRLLWLDDVWTAELGLARGKGAVADDDVLMFRRLVTEIQDGLREMGERAEELRLMLNEMNDEEFDSVFVAVEKEAHPGPHRRERFLSTLEDFGMRGAAITACAYVHETAAVEIETLRSKLRTIEETGEVPAGDWSLPFRCAGLLMLVGAGVAGTVGLGGPAGCVALTAASAVGFGIREWLKDECPTQLPRISFGRR